MGVKEHFVFCKIPRIIDGLIYHVFQKIRENYTVHDRIVIHMGQLGRKFFLCKELTFGNVAFLCGASTTMASSSGYQLITEVTKNGKVHTERCAKGIKRIPLGIFDIIVFAKSIKNRPPKFCKVISRNLVTIVIVKNVRGIGVLF